MTVRCQIKGLNAGQHRQITEAHLPFMGAFNGDWSSGHDKLYKNQGCRCTITSPILLWTHVFKP